MIAVIKGSLRWITLQITFAIIAHISEKNKMCNVCTFLNTAASRFRAIAFYRQAKQRAKSLRNHTLSP